MRGKKGRRTGRCMRMRRQLIAQVEGHVQEKLLHCCGDFETRTRGLYIHLSRGVYTYLVLMMVVFLDFHNARDARNLLAYSTPVRCGALVLIWFSRCAR